MKKHDIAVLNDNISFLQGVLQGLSYHAESHNMSHALESCENQLNSIKEQINQILDQAYIPSKHLDPYCGE